jgi:hypothetical protein
VSEGTGWRLALARRIAAPYVDNPNARVVMVAGSVGRGAADRWSDIEIDVYYEEPPTEADRIAAVESWGGGVAALGEDEVEWEERFTIGGFHAHTSTFLASTMERFLREVVDDCSVDPEAQSRLFSLQHAVPLKGEAQIERWLTRAEPYPEGLRRAMLVENLDFGRFRYAAEMLVARDDLLLLYDSFIDVGRRLIGALLGVNRIYLPTPSHPKWMDETISLLPIAPSELSARLKRTFRVEPAAGVAALENLMDETLELVEVHVPGFDTSAYRAVPTDRRRAWEGPPRGAA